MFCAATGIATIALKVFFPPAWAETGQAASVVIVGTNTPADAEAINAAIAASQEGAEIVFRGQFLITQPIRLLGNRTYRGESRTGTVLRQADGANLPVMMASSTYLDNQPWTGTPLAVRHLMLDGNRSKNPDSRTVGLALRSWLSVVEDVHIANTGGDGLLITNLSADGTLLNSTQVNGRVSSCFIEGCGGHGVHVQDSGNAITDWTLTDNWIAGSGGDAIHLENAAGWFVERNHIYGVGGHAIYAHRLFGSSISNNYIEGFGEGGQAGTWCGIWASLQGGPASTIAHNRIF
ncbi:MAG: right-handed parallel beta-helix repeat-containing protein, partial [Armatimonadetes bacterium]|nr:right-handed parallel beta-helix repeat-containing protein [Armatimonadota bacterium]